MSEKINKKKKSKGRVIFEWIFTGFFLFLFAIFGIGQIDAMINFDKNYKQYIRLGVGNFIVQTESMEPELKVNNAIITYKESLDTIYKSFTKQLETKSVKEIKIDITFFNQRPKSDLSDLVIDDSEFQNPHNQVVTNKVVTHRIREVHFRSDKKLGEGRYVFICAGINEGAELYDPGQYQIVTENEYLGTVKINSPFLGAVFGFLSTPFGLIIFLFIPAIYLIVTSTIDINKAIKEKEEDNNDNNPSGGDRIDNLSKEDQERLKKELMNKILNGEK